MCLFKLSENIFIYQLLLLLNHTVLTNDCIKELIFIKVLWFFFRVVDPETGRYMEVHTDQPGMQVYTSTTVPTFKAKHGAVYGKSCAICFETQKYPNAVHIVRIVIIIF